MTREKTEQPDAEDAKVTQRTQKRKTPFGISFAPSAKPLRLLHPVFGIWCSALYFIAPAAYSTPACSTFSKHLPNVSLQLCQQAQLSDSGARSVKGQPIYTQDLPRQDAKMRVLVVGGIHGDELSTASLALYWLQLAKEIPADAHWRFIPLLNPDGLLSTPARRTNANGVDLNRNFPTPNWEREAKIYWEQKVKRDPRRWPGPKPLSEPESKFLHDEMERFKPHLIVSIHAPYGVLDFDGPTTPPAKLGRLYLDQVGIFPGSLGNYGGVHKGMPVVTIELPSAFRTPLNAEMRQMWLDLLRWMSERLASGEKPKTPTKSSTP
ncbi:MAG: murein peptide amidase A [Burkholderiales bacterium]|nr:MAG: murein peptide amidase A [Burkholderiales bacterium]